MNKWLELSTGLILVIAVVLVWGYSSQWGSFKKLEFNKKLAGIGITIFNGDFLKRFIMIFF